MWKQLIRNHDTNYIQESSETFRSPEHGSFIWMDVLSPTEQEQQRILKDFYPFHSVDAGKSDRPEVELNTDYLFFTMYRLEYQSSNIKRRKIAFYLGRSFLVSVHDEPIPEIETIWAQNIHDTLMSMGGETVLYQLLGKLIAEYEGLRNDIARQAELINESVIDLKARHLMDRLVNMRKEANMIRKEIGPHIRVLRLMKSDNFPYVDPVFTSFFNDLFQRTKEVDDELNDIIESINGVIQAYTSVQSNATNDIMKTLTIISTIFLPATLIASIYGMNFKIPEYNWPHGYAYALIVILVVAFGSLVYMRWKRWL